MNRVSKRPCTRELPAIHKNKSGHRAKGMICDKRHKHCMLCGSQSLNYQKILEHARKRERR